MSAILNSAFGFNHFSQKNFTHSFWLNLMMAAILNSSMLESGTAILDSDTLLSSLRFTQKHSHSTLTMTQTNSIWLKLIYSHLTWWCQPSWNLPSWIQPFLNKKKLHSFILTQLYDGSHLEYCHLGFSNFAQTLTQTNSFWLNLMISAILYSALLDSAILNKKKNSLIHSDSNLWWQPSWILPSWIQLFCTKTLHSYIVTHLDDCSHLEFCLCGFSHCHLGFRHLVIFSQIHSKTLACHSDFDWN